MENEITLDDMIEFVEHGIIVHGDLARQIEKVGFTENIHANYEQMFIAIGEELWRLRDLES